MTEEVAVQEATQDDAEALASAMAGYNKARGDEPPATEEPAQEDAQTEEVAQSTEEPPAVSNEEISVAEELKALKEKVAALKESHGAPDAIRKMYGEIGNINRTLQQMQQTAKAGPQKEDTPAKDDLAAVLAEVEGLAADDQFPELVGPIAKALKLINAAKGEAKAPQMEEFNALVESRVSQLTRETHLALLNGIAPEWDKIIGLPNENGEFPKTAYRDWLAAKPAEYRERMESSVNAIEIKQSIDAFQAETQEKQRKQNKLAAAVVSKGTSQAANPSVIPDEQGAFIGYNRAKKRFG